MPENNYRTVNGELRRIRQKYESDGQLNDRELSRLMTYLSTIDQTEKEPVAEIEEFTQQLAQDPEMQDRIELLRQDPANAAMAQKISQGLDAIQNIAGIGIATGQIKRSEGALSKLKKPRGPKPFQRSEELQSALDEVRQGFRDPASTGVLSPLRQAIQEAYSAGIQQAQTSSTGQAGSFGAQAQSLYNQRLQNALEQVPYLEDVRSRYGNMYQGLLGQQQREEQVSSLNELRRYDREYDDYTREAQEAATLGQAGRQNLYQSISGLKPFLAQSLSGLGRQVQGIGNDRQRTGIDDIDLFEDEIDQSLEVKSNPNLYGFPAEPQIPYRTKF